MGADWSIAIGVILIVIGLVASIIIFSLNRKYYPVLFLIGLEIYVFSVFYAWDLYELQKNQIMLLLVLSTLLLGFLGYNLSKRSKNKDNISKSIKKETFGIIVFSILILSFFIVNAFANLSVEYNLKDKVSVILDFEGNYEFGEITITNPSIFPKVYQQNRLGYCINDRAYYFDTDNLIEISGKEVKTIKLIDYVSYTSLTRIKNIENVEQFTINEFERKSKYGYSDCANSKVIKVVTVTK